MRVVILRNSSSGRGNGQRAVAALSACLTAAGHDVVILDVQRGIARDEQLVAALNGSGVLVIAGGDGTVHHAVPIAMELAVPIIHYPMGTENLFAREFGSKRIPVHTLASIDAAQSSRIDVGFCGTRCFTLMGSIGFDACIVERVAAARTGGVTRSLYIRQALSEMRQPRFVPLTIHVDGRELVADRAGMVVIANSRQYAARLDPARNASMTDGALDVIFLPMTSRVGIIRRGLQVLTGSHMRDSTVLRARGSAITLTPSQDVPLQLDGEYAGLQLAGRAIQFEIRPAALSVLVPR